jgi:hypothetical protein
MDTALASRSPLYFLVLRTLDQSCAGIRILDTSRANV